MNESIGSRYLTMKALEKAGNSKPTKQHFAFMESLLFNIGLEQKLLFARELTAAEIGCLRLAAMGISAREMAKHLSIKKTTVDSHFKKIKRKLACKTMAHAVFIGMRFGYLEPKRLKKSQETL